MKQIQILFATIVICFFSNSTLAMGKTEFFQEFAKCLYPYFSSGMKWNLPDKEQEAITYRFGRRLIGVVEGGFPMNDQMLSQLCSAYRDTSAPAQASRLQFEQGMAEMGMGQILDAFKMSR